MENNKTTSGEGTQTSTEGTGRTFTQEDVNRIVQERLAKEKGKGNEELDKRAAELDMRERKMNAVQKLRENNLPDYLVDALNMESEDAFQKSMEAIIKLKDEDHNAKPKPIGSISPIGKISKGIERNDLRAAFGLE